MSLFKSGAEIQAQLDETNESVNLLQNEIGQAQARLLKAGHKLPDFAYVAFSGFVRRWSEYYDHAASSIVMLNLGSTYDTAAEYLRDCHSWRKRAVRDGALASDKGSDPYSEPPKDQTADYLKGGMVIAALYLVARLVGK